MKRLTFIIIFVIQLLNVMAYDFEVDGIYYNITSEENKTVEVTYGKTKSDGYYYYCNYNGNITIPSTIMHNEQIYSVTKIGNYAFATSYDEMFESYSKDLKSIKLPSSIECVGENAFHWCNALTTIILPTSIKSIEMEAFTGCDNLNACYILCTTPPTVKINSWIFPFPKKCKFFVPQKEQYIKDSTWKQYENKIIEIVTMDTKTFEYTGKRQDLIWNNNLTDYQLKVSEEKTEKDAGNYSMPVHFLFTKDNKEFYSYDQSFDYTINKKQLTLKINDTKRMYGEDNPEFSYTELSGFVNGESAANLASSPILTSNTNSNSKVGTYNIIASIEDKNYSISKECKGTLTIEKAPLTATVNALKTYGKKEPIELKCTYEGLRNGETDIDATFTTNFTVEQFSDVGEYPITITEGSAENYYFKKIKPGVLTITPAPLTISTGYYRKTYGDKNPTFYYNIDGLYYENQDKLAKEPTYKTEATTESSVGLYSVIPEGADAGKNYAIGYKEGTLEITKRQLDIYPENTEREYNQENPNFTARYEGFACEDNESCLEQKPTFYTDATKNSSVGNYGIYAKGAMSTNYDFYYHWGNLTVKKASQSIIWEQNFGKVEVGNQVELFAKATSGLPIEYKVTPDNAETYSVGEQQYLDCQKAGEITISATQSGNANYNGALRISKKLTIDDTTDINSILADKENIKAYYNLSGKMLSAPQKGVIVIKYKDGKTKTALIK